VLLSKFPRKFIGLEATISRGRHLGCQILAPCSVGHGPVVTMGLWFARSN
jgi:hypothetical protein